jgi:hypothetical protein
MLNPEAPYFLHVELPHAPWEYFPDGTTYTTFRGMDRMPGLIQEGWSAQEDLVAQGHRRHLWQVRLVDVLLGEVLTQLKTMGMYDPSLLLVTADHGVSFHPSGSRRDLTMENREDILPVPLFIKVPHQRQGAVNDRAVETIDILPTIADVLDAPLPWPVDGHSVLDVAFPERLQRTALPQAEGERKQYPFDPTARHIALANKVAHLRPDFGLDGPGPVRPSQWWGKRVLDLQTTIQPSMRVTLDHADFYERVDPQSGFIPAQITGRIAVGRADDATSPLIAVAINGVISGGAHTFQTAEGEKRFSILVERDAFRPGKNEVEVFVVSASDAGDVRLIQPQARPKEAS